MKPQTRIVIPDLHIPFHDPRLWALLLEHVIVLKPHGVDILGDVLDCYSLSRFNKNPLRRRKIGKEVDTARKMLEDLRHRVGPACDIRMSEGNHENRLRQVLWSGSKELADLHQLSIPSLLGLDRPMVRADKTVAESLGIRYYGPETPYKVGSLWYIHGDLGRKCNWSMSFGGRLAEAVAKRIGDSVIMGHSHQMGKVMYRTWERLIRGHEVGCMCNFNLEYIVGYPQWQQGWAVVNFTKGGHFQVHFVESVTRKNQRGPRTLLFMGEEIAHLPPAKVHKLERS